MWAVTWPVQGTNFVVQGESDPVHAAKIAGNIAAAGAEPYRPGWFFPAQVRRIHRTPICNGPVDPDSQFQ